LDHNVGIGTTNPDYGLTIESSAPNGDSRNDLVLKKGNLRLWGAIYDTFGGGDQYYLDLNVGGRLGGNWTFTGSINLCYCIQCAGNPAGWGSHGPATCASLGNWTAIANAEWAGDANEAGGCQILLYLCP